MSLVTNRRVITISEACDLVGVSRQTILDWMASGKVGYTRTRSGALRILADTLWCGPHLISGGLGPGEPVSSTHGSIA